MVKMRAILYSDDSYNSRFFFGNPIGAGLNQSFNGVMIMGPKIGGAAFETELGKNMFLGASVNQIGDPIGIV